MNITVKMPSGATMTARVDALRDPRTALLLFGDNKRPHYAFDSHTGKSKDSKLRGWRVVEEDLERFLEAVRSL